MTQIIPISIGKTGIESSSLLWQLISLEHKIGADGILKDQNDNPHLKSLYHQVSTNKFKLNTICLDTDSSTIDSLKTSSQSGLYESANLISGKFDSGGMFSKCFYDGNQIVEICFDPIRKVIESSEKFGGFMLTHSTAGGAGSGISSRLLVKISQQFEKKQKMCINIKPEYDDLCAKSAYNNLFTSYNQLEYADVVLLFDNESLTTLCQTQLNIKEPKYNDLNQLIAYNMSSLTVGFRRDACMNNSIDEIVKNYIPYHRVKYLLNTYSPFTQTSPNHNPMPKQLTIDLFEKKNMLADCSLEDGKMLGCGVYYRGDIIPKDVGPGIIAVKTNRKIQFVDWCPTGFKCGIQYNQPIFFQNSIVPRVTRTAYALFNNTAVKDVFSKEVQNFNEFYEAKTMVHEYLESGLELDYFTEAIESVMQLIADYNQMQIDTEEADDAAMPEPEEG